MSDTLEHRGYRGSVESSLEGRVLHGRLLGIRDKVTYGGKDWAELKAHFIEAVDVYVEYLEEAAEAEPEDPEEQAELVQALLEDDRGETIPGEQAKADGDRRLSEEPENWRRRVYRPGFVSDEMAAMIEAAMAEEEDEAPPECLFPYDPRFQTSQRQGYTRDENILREWHREVFGESLWIDSELHEAIRKRTIEFRRNPDEETVPWEQVRMRLERRAFELRARENRDL